MGQKNSSQRQGKAIKPTKPSQRILEYLHFYIYIYIYIIFYHFKCYFIYYTISFYNIFNIPTFILKYNTLKYYKLYYKVINKFSISLHFLIFVIACLSLSQPNNPITTMPTTPPLPTTHQKPTGTKNLKKKKKKNPTRNPTNPLEKKTKQPSHHLQYHHTTAVPPTPPLPTAHQNPTRTKNPKKNPTKYPQKTQQTHNKNNQTIHWPPCHQHANPTKPTNSNPTQTPSKSKTQPIGIQNPNHLNPKDKNT